MPGRPTPLPSSWLRSATGRRRGSHWGLGASRRATARPRVSTGTPPRRSRKSASERGGRHEGTAAVAARQPRAPGRMAGARRPPWPEASLARVTRLGRGGPAAVLTVASCLFLAGCGGSGGDVSTSADPGGGKTPRSSGGLRETTSPWSTGTSTHEVGDVRISFLVLDAEGGGHAPHRTPSGVARAGLDTVPRVRRPARAHRRSRGRRGRVLAHLRRPPPPAPPRQVLAARGDRGGASTCRHSETSS